MVDTADLAAFRALAEAPSLTEAARRLGCSQPALSRRIQRMEAELGAELVERGRQRSTLTPAGTRVLAFSQDTLSAYDSLQVELRTGTLPVYGTIRIVASTTPADSLVPELVARFSERYPDVRAQITVTDSAAVAETLLDHRADLGFAGRKNPHDRLTFTPITTDEVVLAVPADHVLAARETAPLTALEGERLIWREDGSGTQRTFLDAVTAAGLELPAGPSTVSLGSTQAVLAAVEAGLGIGVVSLRVLERHRSQRVAALRVAGVPVPRHLWLVYETRQPRAAHVAAFLAVAGRAARPRDESASRTA